MVKHTVRKQNDLAERGPKGLEFYLSINEDGEVMLNAAADNDTSWQILKIANNGCLSLASDLDTELGLEVSEDNGKIEIAEETF